jgi:hypothetical protein
VRLRVAQAALKRWRGEPVFELHAFEAKYPNGYDGRSLNSLVRLEVALDRASQAGDTRTVLRIRDILAEHAPFGIGSPSFSPPPATGAGGLPDLSNGEVLATLIDAIGLDRAFDMLGLPPQLRRELKQLERRFGKPAVMEALASAMDAVGDIGAPDMAPPAPRPPPRRSSGRESPEETPREGGSDQDDPSADQLDLFS